MVVDYVDLIKSFNMKQKYNMLVSELNYHEPKKVVDN